MIKVALNECYSSLCTVIYDIDSISLKSDINVKTLIVLSSKVKEKKK